MIRLMPNSRSPYSDCRLCSRACGVDRNAGQTGFCGETAELRIATASIHRGEEPPITGLGGSGTVFVTGCTLGCSFCQNHQISQRGMGAPVDRDLFAEICLRLEREGAENINIVTGSHAVPAIAEGLAEARRRGLSVPGLWNSSAYESVEGVDLLAEAIDVYLPDLKTLDGTLSARFFRAPDYPQTATAAITRMAELSSVRFAPSRHADPAPGEDAPEVLVSGVVVRHLVLPDRLDSTRAVLRWFADNLAGKALLSLMTQYTPIPGTERAGNPPPQRFVDEGEYARVVAMLEEFDIEDGFYQELVPGSDWLPDFLRTNPFSSELSVPVWHWRDGFLG